MSEEKDLRRRIEVLEQQLAAVLGRSEPNRAPQNVAFEAEEGIKPRPRRGQKRSNHTTQPSRPAMRSLDHGPAAATDRAHIPGVRIAYVGARRGAVESIRAYWEGRGATFIAYEMIETSFHALDRSLGRADIIFYCTDSIGDRAISRLRTYCDQTEKTVIPVNDSSVSGLEWALESWRPLT